MMRFLGGLSASLIGTPLTIFDTFVLVPGALSLVMGDAGVDHISNLCTPAF